MAYKTREKYNEYAKKWKKTNPWSTRWTSINRRIKECPSYRGIKNLLTIKQIKKLWFRDKAYLMKKPSLDRKNPHKNYEYSNCQFIEMMDNISKPKRWYKRVGYVPWHKGKHTGLVPKTAFKKGNIPWNKGKKLMKFRDVNGRFIKRK